MCNTCQLIRRRLESSCVPDELRLLDLLRASTHDTHVTYTTSQVVAMLSRLAKAYETRDVATGIREFNAILHDLQASLLHVTPGVI